MRIQPPYLRQVLLAFISLFAVTSAATATTVWYVDASATGSNNGTSWTNAYVLLDSAITAASAGDEIWVVQGTYTPPIVGTPPNATSTGFVINKRLKIYGGFVSGDASVAARSGAFLNTILDGNINNPALYSDNAYNVLNISGVSASGGNPGVLIDGFRIQGGFATPGSGNGAGILATQTDLDIANCFIWNNYAPSTNGGGIYFTSGNGGTYPTVANVLHIKNTEFTGNTGYLGGGIYGDEVRGEVVNTIFSNHVVAVDGSGVALTGMTIDAGNHLDFTNCLFYSNLVTNAGSPANAGGGIGLLDTGGYGGNANMVNCTFVDNKVTAGLAGQAVNVSTYSQATMYNSIAYYNNSQTPPISPVNGTITIGYSDVEGIGAGSNNINSPPAFTNYGLGRLTLSSSSPCRDAADYSRVPLDDLDADNDGNTSQVLPVDLNLSGRLVDQAVADTGAGGHGCSSCTYLDMGCFERP